MSNKTDDKQEAREAAELLQDTREVLRTDLASGGAQIGHRWGVKRLTELCDALEAALEREQEARTAADPEAPCARCTVCQLGPQDCECTGGPRLECNRYAT